MRGIFHRQRKAIGMPPGSLVYTGDAQVEKTSISAVDYNAEYLNHHEDLTPEECHTLTGSTAVTWINVNGLGNTETIRRMGELFGIHPLILEDILNTQQRPRVQDLEGTLYVVMQMVYNEPGQPAIEEQISLVLGPSWVITFQERPGDPLDPIRTRLERGAGRIRGRSADYLAYALIDTIVDRYFPVLEHLGDRILDLETAVLDRPEPATLQSIHHLKRELIGLRRYVWPLREVISSLTRGESPLVSETTGVYLRDVHDHVIQIMDILESYREMAGGLAELYMSGQSNRMNEVMKVLTVIATIFIPLTFIAGVYGMNFDPAASPLNMPELGWYWGYPAAIAAMLLVTAGMLFFFRRRRWL